MPYGNFNWRIKCRKKSRGKVEGKYGKYLLVDVIKDTLKKEWEGQVISAGPGHEDLLPSDIWVRAAITAVRKPYMFHEIVHKHMFTEYFFFFGSNPMDMKEFDAGVEFSFGTEKKKHVINSPTVVIVPPGVYHYPLNYVKVGKPFYCLEVSMTSKYTSTDLKT